MAKKRFRKRRRFKRRSKFKSSVKSLIKKEMSKTQEIRKIVSFVRNRPVRTLNVNVAGIANTPWENTVVYSLTGGRIREYTASELQLQNPDANTPKSLFPLRPPEGDSTSLAGDGGIVDSNANINTASYATSGVHVLQGRSVYLKNFYCNIRINNQGHSAFTTPDGTSVPAQNPQSPVAQFIRVMVVQTRRMLGGMRAGGSYVSLARQILLQYQSGDPTQTQAAPAADIQADSVTGFVNMQTVKKVMYDKIVWLGDGDNGTAKTQFVTRLKIPLNKKAYWNYQYSVETPASDARLSYQGPFYYLLAFTPSLAEADVGLNSAQLAPRMDISSILTFLDD